MGCGRPRGGRNGGEARQERGLKCEKNMVGQGFGPIYAIWVVGQSYEHVMTHKYRGSQQSSREIKSKFIDSTQGEPNNVYKP